MEGQPFYLIGEPGLKVWKLRDKVWLLARVSIAR